MVHSHTVHLPRGALLIGCTVCGAGTLDRAELKLMPQKLDPAKPWSEHQVWPSHPHPKKPHPRPNPNPYCL